MTAPVQRVEVEVDRRLDATAVAEVLAIVDAATDADGVHPLSEHVRLHLRYGGDEATRNVLARDQDGRVLGYAHLDVTDEVEGPSAELVVHPEHRRQGVARRLVERLLAESPDGRLRLWAHGGHADADRLAGSMGFRRTRSLWQMRRSLYAALPAPVLPDGVTVREFRPGADDEEWVRLNALAFADHSEQGALTVDDLHRRMREPWFDPAGFFVATRTSPEGERMVGYHWTKIHGGHEVHDHDHVGPHAHEGHGHDPIGEVYVVGVHPDEQGSGLGRALTLVGLRHLRSRGLAQAMLYVDESNVPAVRVYSGLGFTRWDTDVMYARD
ncbi:MAG TPA: mycothiol synthase [Jiangellales bacterium]|nr:mycothiol synthase [Jiangellales bacterium]